MVTNEQTGLFEQGSNSPGQAVNDSRRPLAYRARPDDLNNYVGQTHLFKRYPFLRGDNLPSIVLWGPPGTGKTTLAHILAKRSGLEFYRFNAVLGGIADLKKLIASASEMRKMFAKESLIFIDEIHRFNKAQQDALLPHVEAGDFTLIGATTENPRSSVNRALLSRLQVVELSRLSSAEVLKILEATAKKYEIKTPPMALDFIAEYSRGDARTALNILDLIQRQNSELSGDPLNFNQIQKLILENSRDYDKDRNRHYDVISAFIKSMRGSDPNAALLWLAVMIDGGEDPVFIARRLVVFASEDIGNADPMALTLATSTLAAVSSIGMPEARINLAQAVTYLASAQKSNAAYLGINSALEYVESKSTIEVPNHLRNQHEEIKDYKYPHSYKGSFIEQNYADKNLPKFYKPTENGIEARIKKRLDGLWG
jgi:putative ATPase